MDALTAAKERGRIALRTATKMRLKEKLFRWLYNADPWMTDAEAEQLMVELRGMGLRMNLDYLRDRKYDKEMRWTTL